MAARLALEEPPRPARDGASRPTVRLDLSVVLVMVGLRSLPLETVEVRARRLSPATRDPTTAARHRV